MSTTKKVVVKVSIGAHDRNRSVSKIILIRLAKVVVPFEFIWEKFAPTSAQNKSKALKVAVSLPGVQEAGLEGDNNDQLVVKGNHELDPVILIKKLRKKIVSAEIVTVGPDKKDEKKKEEPATVLHGHPYWVVPQIVEIPEPSPSCVIM